MKFPCALHLIVVAGCGSVSEEVVPPLDAAIDGAADADGQDTATDAAVEGLPFAIGSIRAATSPQRLSLLTFENQAHVSEAIFETGAEPAFDIVEQRLVATGTAEVRLHITLDPPHGSFNRTLVTAPFLGSEEPSDFDCEGDVRCTTTAPLPESVPASGALTAGRYRIWLLDEESGAPVVCDHPTPNEAACTIVGVIGHTYRVVVSADGFRDLWDWSTSSFGDRVNAVGGPYTGAPRVDLFRSICTERQGFGTSTVCRHVQNFIAVHAIDTARIELAPMTIGLAVGTQISSSTGPAVVWDLGNDDVPGPDF